MTKTFDSRSVLQEIIKRGGDLSALSDEPQIADARTFRWKEDLFDYQLKFIEDPASFKTAVCSRRAGKTYGACFYLIETAMTYPDSLCAYVALTRSSAKRLMWRELKRASRKYMLGIKFNNSELIATLKNDSQIILTGANDEADIDKLRGSSYRLVILDEAGSFGPHMDELVEEVLEPALVDTQGTMVMIGTPIAACAGMFYNAATIPSYGYSNHHWTIRDNPHIPHAEDWLNRRMGQKGWTKEHPVYLREWCGKWVKSDDSLIYRYSAERNIYETLPSDEYDFEYILGIDLGYDDPSAFVVGAFCRHLPDFYVIETHKESRMIPKEIAERISYYQEMYHFTRIVADTGGLGKQIVKEFNKHYGLAVHAAEKKDKFGFIELMNSDMLTGRVKVLQGCGLIAEWELLQWDDDRKKEDGRFENHLADACLYAWRESRHFAYESRFRIPALGSPERFDWEEKRHLEQLEAKILDENNGDKSWWQSIWH